MMSFEKYILSSVDLELLREYVIKVTEVEDVNCIVWLSDW